ncbi:MAG: HSP40/DnaJ peptide-binding protein [Ignavibacteriales bacterium]|nr:HSP40/DnaJ peptide-binding protein [Ignavibacteriales bacterium]
MQRHRSPSEYRPARQRAIIITLRGEGDAGPSGGADGDLYAVIEEKAHDRFERHGDDILYDLKIGVHQAVLGDEVEVPTLKGKAKLFVEPGTPPGKIIADEGEGNSPSARQRRRRPAGPRRSLDSAPDFQDHPGAVSQDRRAEGDVPRIMNREDSCSGSRETNSGSFCS